MTFLLFSIGGNFSPFSFFELDTFWEEKLFSTIDLSYRFLCMEIRAIFSLFFSFIGILDIFYDFYLSSFLVMVSEFVTGTNLLYKIYLWYSSLTIFCISFPIGGVFFLLYLFFLFNTPFWWQHWLYFPSLPAIVCIFLFLHD